MLNPLPFEGDSPELLSALIALLPQLRVQTPEPAGPAARSALPQRGDPGFDAARTVPEPDAETGFSPLDAAAPVPGLSAEALSREIERDARRFEAN